MTWPQQSASRLLLNRVNLVHSHTAYILSLTLQVFFHPYLVLSRRRILLDSTNKALHKNVKKTRIFEQRAYGNLGVRGTAESILEFNQCPNEDVCTSENTRTNKISKASQNDKLYGIMDATTYRFLLARVTKRFSSYVQIIKADTWKQIQPLAQLNTNWKLRILNNCNWQILEWRKMVHQFLISKRVVPIHLGYSTLKITASVKMWSTLSRKFLGQETKNTYVVGSSGPSKWKRLANFSLRRNILFPKGSIHCSVFLNI